MEKVKIADAVHKMIEGNLGDVKNCRGFLLDAVTYGTRGETIRGRIVDISSTQVRYYECDKSTSVTILDSQRTKEVLKGKNMMAMGFPISGVSIGTDPEVFAVSSETGQVIPAFKFLPAKKKGDPHQQAFWDGFQAEFTTYPDGKNYCLQYLTEEVQRGLKLVWDALRDKFPGQKVKLDWKSVVEIPKKMMEEAKPEHLALGCEPSFNAYNLPQIEVDPTSLPIRFAGCHVHMGMYGQNILTKEERLKEAKTFVKAMDCIFGIPSVSLLQGMEDVRRRMYYGRAGEFRLPRYGVEYRVPSSAILASPVLFNLAFDLVRAAYVVSYLTRSDIMEVEDAEVIDIINGYDVKAAQKFIKTHHSIFSSLLGRKYGSDRTKLVMRLILEGAKNTINVGSIHKNWKLGDSLYYATTGQYAHNYNVGSLKFLDE